MKSKYTETQWQMRHMLNDVVTYYGQDPEKLRSFSPSIGCRYNPLPNKPNSAGCAIGMYLPKKVCLKLDRIGGVDTVFYRDPDLLPKWMRDMGVNFLMEVQSLHDVSEFWSEKGLSGIGIERVYHIINKYKLPETIYG